MCQNVKKEINYNWLYFVVHIIIKHNLKEHCNSETLKNNSALDFHIMISLSFCFAQVPIFYQSRVPKEVFLHAYEKHISL